MDVAAVAVSGREPLNAAGYVGPIPEGDVDMGTDESSAEDKCSAWGVHVFVDLPCARSVWYIVSEAPSQPYFSCGTSNA